MELASIGVENTMVCDTAIGALLAEKRVHLFVAGADRCVLFSSLFYVDILCGELSRLSSVQSDGEW